jgi:hypothetical protein
MPFDGSSYRRRWTWKDSPELMGRLATVQNHAAHAHIDIMTFAGMCDSEQELRRHVEWYEAKAITYRPRARKARA